MRDPTYEVHQTDYEALKRTPAEQAEVDRLRAELAATRPYHASPAGIKDLSPGKQLKQVADAFDNELWYPHPPYDEMPPIQTSHNYRLTWFNVDHDTEFMAKWERLCSLLIAIDPNRDEVETEYRTSLYNGWTDTIDSTPCVTTSVETEHLSVTLTYYFSGRLHLEACRDSGRRPPRQTYDRMHEPADQARAAEMQTYFSTHARRAQRVARQHLTDTPAQDEPTTGSPNQTTPVTSSSQTDVPTTDRPSTQTASDTGIAQVDTNHAQDRSTETPQQRAGTPVHGTDRRQQPLFPGVPRPSKTPPQAEPTTTDNGESTPDEVSKATVSRQPRPANLDTDCPALAALFDTESREDMD